jgi:phosphatidylethanolamine N-methyltransferase
MTNALSKLLIPAERPETLDLGSVRESLLHIVSRCLDGDPSLLPLSCLPAEAPRTPRPKTGGDDRGNAEDRDYLDPDDFTFWSPRQAQRICAVIRQTFDVEYAPEVILADANVTALAHRILSSKEILTS